MSQILKPAAVTFAASEIKPEWIDSVRLAIAEGEPMPDGTIAPWTISINGCRLEVWSAASRAWYYVGPVFTTPADAAEILAMLTAKEAS